MAAACQSRSDLSRRGQLSAVSSAQQGYKPLFIHNAELVIKSDECGTTIRWLTNAGLSISMVSGKLLTLVACVSFIMHIIDPSMDYLPARCLCVPMPVTRLCTWNRWPSLPPGQMTNEGFITPFMCSIKNHHSVSFLFTIAASS